jgi:4-diphosphocytidyl-2-C-methyl-D-erythritol kinase
MASMSPEPRPDRLFVSAPAKINLCLHVGDKRADGFHELESLVAFGGAEDLLRFERADELTLSIEGMFAEGLSSGEDNLVLKAARLLAARANVNFGARIELQKEIPVASGIGGGSADAAAAIRGLVRLWGLDLSREVLLSIAAELGSDVPVCLASQSAWMGGRGERISPIEQFPRCWFLLVNPLVPVSTVSVFRKLGKRTGVGDKRLDGAFWDLTSLTGYLQSTTNDLEEPAREIAPEIDDVLGALKECPGVMLSRMSGSGATCFGIFPNEELAWNAGQAIVAKYVTPTGRDWWLAGGALTEPEGVEPQLTADDQWSPVDDQ